MANSKRATISNLDDLMDGIEDFMLSQEPSEAGENFAIEKSSGEELVAMKSKESGLAKTELQEPKATNSRGAEDSDEVESSGIQVVAKFVDSDDNSQQANKVLDHDPKGNAQSRAEGVEKPFESAETSAAAVPEARVEKENESGKRSQHASDGLEERSIGDMKDNLLEKTEVLGIKFENNVKRLNDSKAIKDEQVGPEKSEPKNLEPISVNSKIAEHKAVDSEPVKSKTADYEIDDAKEGVSKSRAAEHKAVESEALKRVEPEALESAAVDHQPVESKIAKSEIDDAKEATSKSRAVEHKAVEPDDLESAAVYHEPVKSKIAKSEIDDAKEATSKSRAVDTEPVQSKTAKSAIDDAKEATSKSKTAEPEALKTAEHEAPKTAEHEAPKTAEPEAPKTAEPEALKTAEPSDADSETLESAPIDPEPVESHSTEPEIADPKEAKSKSIKPKTVEPEALETSSSKATSTGDLNTPHSKATSTKIQAPNTKPVNSSAIESSTENQALNTTTTSEADSEVPTTPITASVDTTSPEKPASTQISSEKNTFHSEAPTTPITASVDTKIPEKPASTQISPDVPPASKVSSTQPLIEDPSLAAAPEDPSLVTNCEPTSLPVTSASFGDNPNSEQDDTSSTPPLEIFASASTGKQASPTVVPSSSSSYPVDDSLPAGLTKSASHQPSRGSPNSGVQDSPRLAKQDKHPSVHNDLDDDLDTLLAGHGDELADEIDELLRELESGTGKSKPTASASAAPRPANIPTEPTEPTEPASQRPAKVPAAPTEPASLTALLASEPVYLYTSLAGGGYHMPSRTNRLAHILTANRVTFTYRDLGTDDDARRVWQRYGRGRTLPAVVRGRDDIIGNWQEMEDANEDYRVRELIFETL